MTDTPLRVPPSRVALARFLHHGHALPIARMASLLGWTRSEVRRRAAEDEVATPGGLIPWRAAAAWLVEAWPLRQTLDTLGPDAHLLPVGLHLTPAPWELPFYLTHAMAVQAQVENLPHRTTRPATVSDYVADLLHRSIDTDTLTVLQRDADFLAAFRFAEGRDR